MTEPLTILDPDLIAELEPPPCDTNGHDNPAKWIGTWTLPCEHPDVYLFCDWCGDKMRGYAVRYSNVWNCPVCHKPGRLESLVRL